MKIAASNIAWNPEDDRIVYLKMKQLGFTAIEIAPTRIIQNDPYNPESVVIAKDISCQIFHEYDLPICSMQSIWYGISAQLFGGFDERKFLINYTKSAIDFSASIGCRHVVFGCPRNRIINTIDQYAIGVDFFAECAAYAALRHVVIGIEANPTVYGTNYLNTTNEVLELVKIIGSPHLKVNLDIGTILENQESLHSLVAILPYVSHIHVSEPFLAPLQDRREHQIISDTLISSGYTGWISLEMRNHGIESLFNSLKIVSHHFGDSSI